MYRYYTLCYDRILHINLILHMTFIININYIIVQETACYIVTWRPDFET